MRTARFFSPVFLGLFLAFGLVGGIAYANSDPMVLKQPNDTITVCASTCTYTSIQTAIDNAIPGDVIDLATETYTESITINKNITLLGDGAENTIIQAATAPGIATNRVVTVTAGVNTTIEGLTIRYGNTVNGGGIFNLGTLTLTHIILSENHATAAGGGTINWSGSNATLTNVIFSGNSAGNEGGGLFNYESNPTLTNVIFSGNASTNTGGGMFNYISSPTLINVTFSNNAATNSGGGIYNHSGITTLKNTILWGNSAGTNSQIYSNGSVNTSFSDIQGSGSGGSNIDADPRFVRDPDPGDGDWATLGDNDYGDLHLQDGSPVINSGTNTGCPAIDLDGTSRPLGPNCDMGAYENIRVTAWIDDDWAGASPGTDPDGSGPATSFGYDAFATINDGFIDEGINTIKVYSGTYTETLTISKTVDIIGLDGAENTIWQAADAPGIATSRVVTVSAGISASIDGLTIRNGVASNGGGIYNSGTLTLTHSILLTNTATNHGGGMYNASGSNSTLIDVSFLENSANTSSGNGGGLRNEESNSTLTNVRFHGNSAAGGGGMYNVSSNNVTLTNVIFSGNWGINCGGLGNESSSPTLINLTFSGNHAIGAGGGIYNWSASSPTITNTILWGNTAGTQAQQIYNHPDGSNPVISNSDIQGAGSSGTNIDSNPQFLRDPDPGDGNWATLGDNDYGDLHLRVNSPVIKAGTNTGCLEIDLDGTTRPQGTTCDMGAYEFVSPDTVWVDDDWAGTTPGTDPDDDGPATSFGYDAFATINEGFTGVGNSTINVYSGTYTETLTISKTVDIIGLDGAENTIWQAANAPGIATSRVVTVTAGVTATIDGLTIRYGKLSGGWPSSTGGGIYNAGTLTLTNSTLISNTSTYGGGLINMSGSSSTVSNVTFSGNSADYGGGMENYQSSPTLSNVTFSGNSATSGGGGMYNEDGCNPTLTNVTFSGNSADNGGGIYNQESCSPILTNVTFSGNSATTNSGGMYNNFGSNPTLTNVIFSGNSADFGGGLINYQSSPTLTNVTLAGNSATYIGGGMYNYGNSDPVIKNTILWGNTAGTQAPQTYNENDGSVPVISYSDIQGSGGGGTNIDSNPQFLRDPDPGDDNWTTPGDNDYGDLHLASGSPAIDVGTNTGCPATDLDDTTRPQGIKCDMGVYELDTFALEIDKSVDDATPEPGQAITFTIIVTSTGPGHVNGLISDTLPTGLNFVGPITLEPVESGSVGSALPTLAYSLVISANQTIIVTFPVSVSYGLTGGSILTNTTWVTSTQVVTPLNSSITMTVVNLPPEALDDDGSGFTTDEDTSFSTASVLANDSDPNGDSLTLQSVDITGITGDITNKWDGTFDYDPDGQFEYLDVSEQATITFTYVVSDGLLTDTAPVTITINGVNDPPIALNDSGADFTTDEDTPFITEDVLLNDSDPEDDALSVQSIDTSSTLGVVTNNGDGTFNYDPDGQFEYLNAGELATDTFTYVVSDGVLTDTAIVSITIEGVTDPPDIVWVDDDWAGTELGTDPDSTGPATSFGYDAFATINASYNGVGNSTINVYSGTYTETLTITKTVDIIGVDGAENTIWQAADAPGVATSRVITITSGVSVTIDGLTIRYGNQPNIWGYPSYCGGGIFNQGTLTLTHSIVSHNNALAGGGICTVMDQGTASLYISDTNIVSNTAEFYGGGIYHSAETTSTAIIKIIDSNINDNEVERGSGGGMIIKAENAANTTASITHTTVNGNTANNGFGGGIESSSSHTSTVSITLNSSTISSNSAEDAGGIGATADMTGTINITLTNCTISGNTAYKEVIIREGEAGEEETPAARGGGIFNSAFDEAATANITLINSTISGNTASTDVTYEGGEEGLLGEEIFHNYRPDTIEAGEGGGIINWSEESGQATIRLMNTIIANSPMGGDCFNNNGTVNDQGHNLVEDNSCGFTGGSDPKLGTLQDNGGATETHALLPSSPALDAGDCSGGSVTDDQRGVSRPQGLGCDIGAYESDTFSLEISKSVDDTTVEPGQTITFRIVVTNTGPGITDGQISDNLPAGLNFLGPITLESAVAGTVGSVPPVLVHSLVISANQTITVTFPVTVSRGLVPGSKLTNTASVVSAETPSPVQSSVTVTVVNLPPDAQDDGGPGFTTDEDTYFTTISVLNNDSDPDGGTLSVTGLNTSGTKGLVTNNGDSTFDYDPNGQFEDLAAGEQATDTFTYTISDGQGGSDTATVTITITGVNDGFMLYLPLIVKGQ
jgi:uncharacterized repeat protein (TIGR01451 family)